MKHKIKQMMRMLLLILCLFGIVQANHVHAANKIVSASISTEKVKIGKTITVTSKTKGVSFKSSDTTIAYINKVGIVIGKKAGKVVISVTKKGYTKKKFEVTVVANGKKPSILVCPDEVELVDMAIDINGDFTARIKNQGMAGVKKVVYIFEVEIKKEAISPEEIISEETEFKKIKLTSGKIAAGKNSKTVTCQGPASGKTEDMKLLKVVIYSGKALIKYDAIEATYAFTWGGEDTTAPTITGMVGKNSYNKSNVFMVVYPDQTYDYTKYVSVSDDRDLKVALVVDISDVDFKKNGKYKVIYTATDKAGNKATKRAIIQVRIPKEIDHWANEVLKKITKNAWSEEKKARAIYTYLRKYYSYVDHSEKKSWEASAKHGLKYKSGDCYTYYACSRLLLTRAGIPNLMVKKQGGSGRHWWNLVYIQGQWYHYDTTPRKKQVMLCLITDDQLLKHSSTHGNTHLWDKSKYPQVATKKISEVVLGKRY